MASEVAGAAGPSAALCLTGSLRRAALDPERLLLAPLRRTVLRRFRDAGYCVDIFAVTTASECDVTARALRPLAPRALHCVDDSAEARTPAERRWLRRGPRTAWSREAFLGQFQKVWFCAELILAAGAPYSLLARSRLDVSWHAFPSDVASLEIPGVVWVPWRAADGSTNYMNDRFAIGTAPAMQPYLRAYEALLEPQNWRKHRLFEPTPDGLDTEELWEITLMEAGVLARQHRGLCFNTLAKPRDGEDEDELPLGDAAPRQPLEREDNCRTRPSAVHPHGYILDEVLLERSSAETPGQFECDPLLSARLLHWWYAEWARLARPVRILDLGCGRAYFLERWLHHYPASMACIDLIPGLRSVLGDDVLELDLTLPLAPESLGQARGCRLAPPWNHEEGCPADVASSDDVTQRLMRKCCLESDCVGVKAHEEDVLGLLARQRENWVPNALDLQYWPRNFSRPGTVAWAEGRADWVLLLDVAASLPPGRVEAVYDNAVRLARVGIICASGVRPGEEEEEEAAGGGPPRHLEGRAGLERDVALERWLEPFVTRWRKYGEIHVYRRRWLADKVLWAQRCSLTLLSEWGVTGQCKFGISYGCVDEHYIWVASGCDGFFTRGSKSVACLSHTQGASRSAWTYGSKQWQYVECELHEDSWSHSRKVSSAKPSRAEAPQVALCGVHPSESLLHLTPSDSGFRVDLFGVQLPLLSVRVNFWADVEVRLHDGVLDEFVTWAPPLLAAPNHCLTWNLWPIVARSVRLLFRPRTSKDDLDLSEHAGGAWAPLRLKAASLWAEAVARRTLGGNGLASAYDALDVGTSSWGNGSRLWRLLQGQASPALGGGVDGEQVQLESFAAFALAVRAAARASLGAGGGGDLPPQLLADRAVRALKRSAPPWSTRGVALLRSVGLAPQPDGAPHPELSAGPDVAVIQGPTTWHLRFANTPVGRYLYHLSTLSD